MSLWSRTSAPKWVPSVATKQGYVHVETGELLVAFANPLVMPQTGATITNIFFDKKVYRSGDTMKISVDFSQPVVVTSAPVLGVTINSNVRRAKYVPSRSNPVARLHFYYVVTSSDVATGGQVSVAGTALAASLVKQNVSLIAATAGAAGDLIDIAFVDPGANSQSLSVTTSTSGSNKHIVVHLATNGSGVITSTATLVAAAIVANTTANGWAAATALNGGANVLKAMTATALANGYDAQTASGGIDLQGGGISDGAATTLAASVTAGSGNAGVVLTANARGTVGNSYTLVIQNGTPVAATLTKGAGNAGILFTANAAGVGGNAITITVINPGTNNAALAVTNSSNAITISLATDGSAIATSTAAAVVTAFNLAAGPHALVTASNVGSGASLFAVASVASLTGGTDVTLGVALVGGNAIQVTLATTNGANSTTATQLRTALNGSTPISAIVTTTLVGNGSGTVLVKTLTSFAGGSNSSVLTADVTYNALTLDFSTVTVN